MAERGSWRRIDFRASANDLAEGVSTALHRLGYDLQSDDARDDADARVLTAQKLRSVPHHAREPIVLITGEKGTKSRDDRVVGTVPRPAKLNGLYLHLQAALEDHPREVPRVPTTLAARCVTDVEPFPAAILSLSEKGCLLRSAPDWEPSAELEIQFTLPEQGLIRTFAETRHQSDSETGLVFAGISPRDRAAISAFVVRQLTTAPH